MRRVIVGLLATIGAVTLLLGIGAATAIWLLLPGDPTLPDRVVVTFDLRDDLAEARSSSPLAALGGSPKMTLADAILAIDQAAQEPRVKGMVARLDGAGPGFAKVQELRAAIARFRATGKFALAHADSFGEFGPGTRGYYLASAFDEIHLQPLGSLGLTGLMIETPLLRGLFDKLGVLPTGGKRGAYKNAADMFTETELTTAHREALDSLADSLHGQIVAGIATDRAIEPSAVVRLIDRGPYPAAEAADAGLVDRLSYFDEVVDQAKEQAGAGVALLPLAKAAGAIERPEPADNQVIALVQGVGQIQRGTSSSGPNWVMGADTVAGALAEAIDDEAVAAILFRVDSPGGSAVASETIGRQVRRAIAAGKPVIVSMGDVAASGGYWIAMDASTIVADPGTITGSIGVFAGKPVVAELWDTLGVNWGRVERGANAAMWSTLSDYTARGRGRLEGFLDQVYAAFTEGVARGRDLPIETVRAVAEGRVWTGEQAHELGLVDELGGFARALELTKEAIGLPADAVVSLRLFPPPQSPWEQALELLGQAPISMPPWLSRLAGWTRQLAPQTLEAPPLIVR